MPLPRAIPEFVEAALEQLDRRRVQADRGLSRAEGFVDVGPGLRRKVAGVDRCSQMGNGGEIVASVRGQNPEPRPRSRV